MVICTCGKREIVVKGLCSACYMKKRRKEHPEMYETMKERQRKWRKEHPDIIKKRNLEWRKNNPEKVNAIQKRYLDNHPEKKAIGLENLRKSVICNILKKHSIDLKDDPERLSTEFLQNIIGIKCKRDKEKDVL